MGKQVSATKVGLLICVLAMSSSATQKSIEGHWEGVMVREGVEMMVRFDFLRGTKDLQGNFSSDTHGTSEYPLDLVRYTSPKIHFELGDGSTVFDGELTAEMTMAGSFKEGDAGGTFSLKRVKAEPPPYRTEEVRFRNGDVVLAGMLLIPSSKGPYPTVIFLHGSGPETRWGTARFRADQFARHGIAALIYDKRGTGLSGGDWKRASFDDLAGDAIAGLHFLQGRKEINRHQIGIYGHSQGGFIAPLVAARSENVAFVISAASYAGPAYEQDFYRIRNSLGAHGYSEDEVREAMEMYTTFIDTLRFGEGWDKYDAAIEESHNKRWFEFLELPAKDNWLWQYYRATGNFNCLPYWEKVHAPVFLIYGERDQLVPTIESLIKIEAALRKAGNKDYAAILVPRAAHNLAIYPEPGQPFQWWHTAPGLNDLMIAWIKQRPHNPR